jgi:hypothetical protein
MEGRETVNVGGNFIHFTVHHASFSIDGRRPCSSFRQRADMRMRIHHEETKNTNNIWRKPSWSSFLRGETISLNPMPMAETTIQA